MATAEPTHIGTRIRYWRRRRDGMTQVVLAGRAGLSQSYISMVENGDRTVERRSDLVALANALKVSVPELLGQPSDPTDLTGAAVYVPAVRASLVEIEDGERRTPTRGPDETAAALTRLSELRSRAGYVSMARVLPELLLDAAAYGGVYLAQAGYDAGNMLKVLGYQDLSLTAARVAVHGALESEDPGWIGAARFFYTMALPTESAGLKNRTATRSLTELQASAADPRVRQTLGQLHLSAALACAVDQRPDDAAVHLRAAEQEARTLGDPADGAGFNLMGFGPTNIGLWRMTIAAEVGEHGKVVELAGKVDPGPLRVTNRHYFYWLDLGLALSRSRKSDAEARAALLRAEQATPVRFSVNQMAHDAVLAMVNRAKRGAVPKDLQVLAHRVGIDVARIR